MTVAELIAILQKHNPESEVWFYSHDQDSQVTEPNGTAVGPDRTLSDGSTIPTITIYSS